MVEETDDFARVPPLADVVILSGPSKRTSAFIEELAHLPIKKNVLVTDPRSTQLELVQAPEASLADHAVGCVGTRPMAGSHKSGASAAHAKLLANTNDILTPTALTTCDPIEELREELSSMQAAIVTLDAAVHDRGNCPISHLPQVIAASFRERPRD